MLLRQEYRVYGTPWEKGLVLECGWHRQRLVPLALLRGTQAAFGGSSPVPCTPSSLPFSKHWDPWLPDTRLFPIVRAMGKDYCPWLIDRFQQQHGGWPGHVTWSWGHPSGKKGLEGLGPQTRRVLWCIPVPAGWEEGKPRDVKDGTLSCGVQGSSSQRQRRYGERRHQAIPYDFGART